MESYTDGVTTISGTRQGMFTNVMCQQVCPSGKQKTSAKDHCEAAVPWLAQWSLMYSTKHRTYSPAHTHQWSEYQLHTSWQQPV